MTEFQKAAQIKLLGRQYFHNDPTNHYRS